MLFFMSHPSRDDIRTKALRAAAKVALLGAATGCGTAQSSALEAQTTPDAGERPQVEDAAADSGARMDAGTVVVGDAGIVMDAGLGIDAGLETCDMNALTSEDYLACCERIGWDWERGCAAWGPPVPPRMSAAKVKA